MLVCWCGNTDFLPFGSEYGECRVCGTLVYLKEMSPDQLLVRDDETDFYGKKYWLEHQQDAFGYTDIYNRARNDLTERNLHWLKALLKYRLPPAEVLEVGCAHGSFVALMQQAGYEASGVELSPWVVSCGRETFGVSIHIGPVESLNLPLASLDVIALMDVLEHLPDPMATMRCCLELLKPDGLLLIQTPQFKEGMCYEALVESKNVFLDQLKSDEHLYLFSERSVTDFFGRLGAEHIYFEPAIFAHYDMFFAVCRVPLKRHNPDEIESALLANPNGRFVLAMLDLRERELDLAKNWRESETDRADRARQIAELTGQLQALHADHGARGAQIADLTALVRERDAQLAALDAQVRELNVLLHESETDRADRARQIAELTGQLQALHADHGARGAQITDLTALVAEREHHLTALDTQVQELNERLRESETDRAARSEQIAELTEQLLALQADHGARGAQITELTALVAEREHHLMALDTQVRELNERLRESETDWADRARQIAELTGQLQALHADHGARGAQIADLTALVRERDAQLAALDAQVRELNALLHESETDWADRARQIAELTAWLNEANADRQARGQQIQELTAIAHDREQQLVALDQQVQEVNRLAQIAYRELDEMRQRLG